MILGSVLLLSAAVVLVALLTRLSAGRPGAWERFALAGVAIALILGGTGMFAAEFLSPSESPKRDNPAGPNNAAAPADTNKPIADLPPQSEPLTQEERANLDWLHRSSVEIFIERPGFGMRRMMMPLQDVVNPPKLTSTAAAEGKPFEDSPFIAPSGKKAPSDRDAHFAIRDVINRHWRGPSPVSGETWSVRSLQLVGLVKNPQPVAYDSIKMPGMKDVKDLPTRQLDAFETRALESLRGGEKMIADKTGKEMRILAPIFAGNRCVTCHAQKGQLLGAFSYVLERGPTKEESTVENLP